VKKEVLLHKYGKTTFLRALPLYIYPLRGKGKELVCGVKGRRFWVFELPLFFIYSFLKNVFVLRVRRDAKKRPQFLLRFFGGKHIA
jgi:hypothetical protein